MKLKNKYQLKNEQQKHQVNQASQPNFVIWIMHMRWPNKRQIEKHSKVWFFSILYLNHAWEINEYIYIYIFEVGFPVEKSQEFYWILIFKCLPSVKLVKNPKK
jgi:hypothetical protein